MLHQSLGSVSRELLHTRVAMLGAHACKQSLEYWCWGEGRCGCWWIALDTKVPGNHCGHLFFCDCALLQCVAHVSVLCSLGSSNGCSHARTWCHSGWDGRAYDWGVNSIHGDQVSCGTNCATNYPLPVAIGAAFNRTLVRALGRMMGVELRALRLEVLLLSVEGFNQS